MILQVIKQKGHKVVDDKGFVALSACVHINCYARVFEGNPLKRRNSLYNKIKKTYILKYILKSW